MSHDAYKSAALKGFITGLGLAKAIYDAGGSVPEVKKIEKMSALDLIAMCSSNGIEFKFDIPETSDIVTKDKKRG